MAQPPQRLLKTAAKERYLLSDADLTRLQQAWTQRDHQVVVNGGRGMFGQQKQLWLVQALEEAAVKKHGSLDALREKLRTKGMKKREREQADATAAAKRRKDRIDALPPPQDPDGVLVDASTWMQQQQQQGEADCDMVHLWLLDAENGLVALHQSPGALGPTIVAPLSDVTSESVQGLIMQELGKPELKLAHTPNPQVAVYELFTHAGTSRLTSVWGFSFGVPSNLLIRKAGGVVQLSWASWSRMDALTAAAGHTLGLGALGLGAKKYAEQLQTALTTRYGAKEVSVPLDEARSSNDPARTCNDAGWIHNDFTGASDPKDGCIHNDDFEEDDVAEDGTLLLRNGLCPRCARDKDTELFNDRAKAAKLLLKTHAPVCRCGQRMVMPGFSTFRCRLSPDADGYPVNPDPRDARPRESKDCGYQVRHGLYGVRPHDQW